MQLVVSTERRWIDDIITCIHFNNAFHYIYVSYLLLFSFIWYVYILWVNLKQKRMRKIMIWRVKPTRWLRMSQGSKNLSKLIRFTVHKSNRYILKPNKNWRKSNSLKSKLYHHLKNWDLHPMLYRRRHSIKIMNILNQHHRSTWANLQTEANCKYQILRAKGKMNASEHLFSLKENRQGPYKFYGSRTKQRKSRSVPSLIKWKIS